MLVIGMLVVRMLVDWNVVIGLDLVSEHMVLDHMSLIHRLLYHMVWQHILLVHMVLVLLDQMDGMLIVAHHHKLSLGNIYMVDVHQVQYVALPCLSFTKDFDIFSFLYNFVKNLPKCFKKMCQTFLDCIQSCQNNVMYTNNVLHGLSIRYYLGLLS